MNIMINNFGSWNSLAVLGDEVVIQMIKINFLYIFLDCNQVENFNLLKRENLTLCPPKNRSKEQ